MPSYTLYVPDTEDAVIKERARLEGVPAKWFLVWLIKARLELPLPPRPCLKPEKAA
jgi:hypothetical protein